MENALSVPAVIMVREDKITREKPKTVRGNNELETY